MNLYELSNSYAELVDLASNEEIDISLLSDTLEAIDDEINIKFENISKLVKNLDGGVAIHKAEEERLAKKRKAMENKINWLKQYMLDSLETLNKDSISAGTFKVARQKNNRSLAVIDEKLIPSEYKTIIPEEVKLEKKVMLDLLKSGQKIEGVEIAPETYHIRIR